MIILRIRVFAIIYVLTISSLFAQSEADSLRRVIRQNSDSVSVVDAMNRLAFILRVVKPDSSILLTQQSEQIAVSIDYPLGIANSKMRRAIAETAKGNYFFAQQLFLQAKSIYESLNDITALAACTNNIGTMYNSMEDYDKALDYFEEAASLYAELKELLKEGSTINNIGYVYKVRGDYDKAIPYFHKTLKRAVELKNEQLEVYPLYNLGSSYMHKSEIDSAKYYLDKALILSKEIPDLYVASLTLADLGQLHLKTNEVTKAQNFLQEAFEIADNTGMRPEKRNAAKYLARTYELQDDFEKAYTYFKTFKAVSDSMFNKELTQKMAIQQAEFKLNEAKVLEEAERQKFELEQQQELANAIWMRNTLLGGLIVMIIISYLLFKNFDRKRKANERLRSLNQQIQRQAEELELANREITVINTNLEAVVNKRTQELKVKNRKLKEYLSSNSHVVRAPLARILGLVQLYHPNESENFDFINKSVHDSATELDNAIREINQKLSDESV